MRKQKVLVSCIATVVCGFTASGVVAQSKTPKIASDVPVSDVAVDVYGQLNYGVLGYR